MAFPEALAVLDVLAQHLVGETGVAELQRHGEIDAVVADLLDEEVVGLLGSAGLAQNGELTVSARDNRLDVEDAARERSGTGDAAALAQVLERVDHGNQADFITFLAQVERQLVETHAVCGAAQCVFCKNAGCN